MSKKTILLIDDDSILSEVIKKRIEEAGYICLWERDGKEGLNRLSSTLPQLLVLDLVLPTMNGNEILEHICAHPTLARIPIMVISNSGEPVEIEHILKLGAKDFIVKAHFSPEEVMEKIKNIIGESDNAIPVFTKKAVRKSPGSTTVLIAEDDVILSEIATDRLRHEGYQVYTVFDGIDALKVATEMKPDIILLDVLMPGMTGFEVLEKLKADEALRGIRVIIFSNLAQEKDIEKGKQLGAADYIIKSNFTPALIVERIEVALET